MRKERVSFIAVGKNAVPCLTQNYREAVAHAWKHSGVVVFYDRQQEARQIGEFTIPFAGGVVRNFARRSLKCWE
jgi:hypothetical protein